MARLSTLTRFVASLAIIAAVTAPYVWIGSINPTTVALSYLLAILAIATRWGIAEATVASIVAMLSFNLFFLPPAGTLTIADPQNWVSFVAFMITAIIASQLSGRARQRRIDAVARQRDLERLYALSRAVLLVDESASIHVGIARAIADAFELAAVALYDQQAGVVSRAGPTELPPGIDDKLHDVARQGVPIREGTGLIVTPIRLGGAPIGSLAISGFHVSDTVLQALVNLVAIGLERARGREGTLRAEAARHSSELRATVLDAVAHEFKTPLTSIKAAVSQLATDQSVSAPGRELVTIIGEETDRLDGVVTDAIQMLRIDAGDFALQRDHHRLSEVVASTIKEADWRTEGRTIVNKVPADVVVEADENLLRLALRQLLDNALKYSPPTSTIEIDATDGPSVAIAVRNSGSSIPEHEQRRIFEPFYRGTQAGHVSGTGMGLAIVQQIAVAHGGDLSVSSTPGGLTEFRLSLPHAEVGV